MPPIAYKTPSNTATAACFRGINMEVTRLHVFDIKSKYSTELRALPFTEKYKKKTGIGGRVLKDCG